MGETIIGGVVGILLAAVVIHWYLSRQPALPPVERAVAPLVADLADETYKRYAAQVESQFPKWPKEDKRRMAVMLGNQCLEQMADYRSRIGYRPGTLA